MILSSTQIGEYVADLFSAKDFDTAFDVFENMAESLGIDSVLYSFIPRVALDEGIERNYLPVFKVSKNFNAQYLAHYEEANFRRKDYTIKQIEQQKWNELKPIDWWEEIGKGVLSDEEVEVMAVARADYQMTNGFTLPLMSKRKGIAAASFVSEESDMLFRQLRTERFNDIKHITHIFHQHVRENAYEYKIFTRPLISRSKLGEKIFSNMEKRVLKELSITGGSVPFMASTLNLSEGAVEKAIRRMRFKIGGETIFEGIPCISKDLLIHYADLMELYDHLL